MSVRLLESPAAAIAGHAMTGTFEVPYDYGSYRLIAPLGSGGMGDVYRARDMKLGRDVAVKVLPPHLMADPERRARFSREARLLAALNHPHIAAIHGLEGTDGIHALILELVAGSTLADRLEYRRSDHFIGGNGRWSDPRDTGLHESRTGARLTGRQAHRHLVVRLRVVRNAHRVVAGWSIDCVQLRQRRQLRHLGEAARRRSCPSAHEFSSTRNATGVVARRDPHRVSNRRRQRRLVSDAG